LTPESYKLAHSSVAKTPKVFFQNCSTVTFREPGDFSNCSNIFL